MIVFSHILRGAAAANTGDLASGPYRWFGFPGARIQNYDAPVPAEARAVVYGGGTMVNWLRGRELPDCPRVLWGAGSSRRDETEPWPDPEGFDLIGTREWTPEREAAGLYAPCASCMSDLFDRRYRIEHPAVIFLNASPSIHSAHPVTVGGLPVMANDQPMHEIIAFLGSAKNVITNSYHGMIWATWLGRRPIVVPYSSKFYGLKHPPQYSADGGLDWRERAAEALNQPGALEDARAATVGFAERVRELLGERAAA